jgi:glycosyltransferase involved in cell wall biosynthesis
MRYLIIVEATATGTLSMISALANMLINKNIEVFIIYSIRDETPKDILNYFDQRVQFINIQMNSAINKIKSIFLIRNKTKRICPNLIHLHSSFAGFIGRIALFFTKYVILYSPHCISFQRKDIGILKRYTYVFFENIANILKTSTYIACSDSEAKNVKKYVKNSDVRVVENILDDEVLQYIQKTKTNENCLWSSKRDINIVCVGQIRRQKDPASFAYISKCTNEMFSNNIKNSFNFIWIGDGDDYYKRTLEESGVYVTGWISKTEVLSHLLDADIYLSTSKWEGMPISVMEALAAGCICVCSSCDGNTDIIEDRSNGFLFTDNQQAIDIIVDIINNYESYLAIANNAASSAYKRFQKGKYIEEILSISGCMIHSNTDK